jgi:hypothetical protein
LTGDVENGTAIDCNFRAASNIGVIAIEIGQRQRAALMRVGPA